MSKISVGGGLSLGPRYDTIEEAIDASKTGDTLVIKENINLSKTVKINHNLTIDGNNNTIIYDNNVGIHIPNGNVDFNNLSIICDGRCNAINVKNSGEVNLSLSNVNISHKEVSLDYFYPSLFSKKIDGSDNYDFNLEIYNCSIDFIWASDINKLIVGGDSKIGDIATKFSRIDAEEINIENSQVNNFNVVSDDYNNTIVMNNVSTIGGLSIYGNLSIDNFNVDPLPDSINNEELSKKMKEFKRGKSLYALITNSIKSKNKENVNIIIKNTNLNSDGLMEQVKIFTTGAWFKFNDSNVTFINSDVKHDIKDKSYTLDSNIKLDDSNVDVNWNNNETDALLNNKKYLLKNAVNESKPGDTITLKNSITLKKNIDINHDLIIDGNGHTINVSDNIAGFYIKNSNVTFNNLNVIMGNKCNFINKQASGNADINVSNVKITHLDSNPDTFYPALICFDSLDDENVVNLYISHSEIDFISFLKINNLKISQSSVIGNITKKTSDLYANNILVNDSMLSAANVISRNDNIIKMNNVSTLGELSVKGNVTLDGFKVLPLPNSENYSNYDEDINKFKGYNSVYSLITDSNNNQKVNVEINNANLNSDQLIDQQNIYSVSSWFHFLNSNVKIIDSDIGNNLDGKNVLNSSEINIVNTTNNSEWDDDQEKLENNSKSKGTQYNYNITKMPSNDSKDVPARPAMEEINDLIGLESVKKQLKKFINLSTINKLREEKQHIKSNLTNMNMVFEGNPGTGKTVMARLFARALYENGVLKANKLVEVKAKDLVAGFVGQTSQLTADKVNEALDGVLFIDEAYSLAPPKNGGTSFNNEAIDELIADMENNRNRLVVIMAGYHDDMEDFFKRSNQGLASRFPNKVTFPDYNSEELLEIFDLQLEHMYDGENGNYVAQKCTPEAREIVKKAINKLYDSDKINDNARFVRDKIVGKISESNADRIANELENVDDLSADALDTFTEEDAKAAMGHLLSSLNVKNDLDDDNVIDDNNDENAIDTLNGLIGLQSVKSEALKLIEIASVNKFKKEHNLPTQLVTMNMVFEGNPGTGKTVVARLFAKALYENGVLKTDNFKEVKAGDLVGRFVGQTAPKTKEVVMSALNGVLFIDEAYQLAPSSNGGSEFNDEAVTELLADVENNRDKIVVIMAGYTKEMEDLFKNGNPGLSSRFPNRIIFPDYSDEDLFKILQYTISKNNLICTDEALNILKLGIDEYLDNVSVSGNGRFVRNLVDTLIGYQSGRINSLLVELKNVDELSDEQKEQISTINADDAKKAVRNIINDSYNN